MPRRNTQQPAPSANVAPETPPRPLTAEERLAAKAKKAPDKPAAASKDWTIDLGEEAAESLLRFCAANHGAKILSGKAGTARAELETNLLNQVVARWVKEKRRMPNPKVQTSRASVNFLCADTSSRFTLRPAEGQDAPNADEFFANCGINGRLRDKIRGDFEQKKHLELNLGALKEASPELYDKVINLILEASDNGVYNVDGEEVAKFSEEETTALLTNVNEVKVKEGFLDRLPQYCIDVADGEEQTAKQNLLKMLTALQQVRGVQFKFSQPFCQNPQPVIGELLAEGTDENG